MHIQATRFNTKTSLVSDTSVETGASYSTCTACHENGDIKGYLIWVIDAKPLRVVE